jgi:hypothetical protein
VITASKEIEPGFRTILAFAEGLFRIDVALDGDTLRTVVRNLSRGELRTRRSGEPAAALGFGEFEAYQPGQARLEFEIDDGEGAVDVDATIGTLRYPERGIVKVSAQVITRRS